LISPVLGIHQVAASFLERGGDSSQVTALLSRLSDQCTRRLVESEYACLKADFCWMVLGSEGRSERTFLTDQDNALIFSDDSSASQFLSIAQRINEKLDQLGFPLCKGGVMAGNPTWSLSLSDWKETCAEWVHRGDAKVLLQATIFFDFRALHGDFSLVADLRTWLRTYLKQNWLFLRELTYHALENRPPIGGFLHDFVLDGSGEQVHTLDLKVHGVALFVDAARVFALAAGISETNTVRRLRTVAALWHQDEAATERWVRAFDRLQGFRLWNQKSYLSKGFGPKVDPNRIRPADLSEFDKKILRECFKQAKRLQESMERNFQF